MKKVEVRKWSSSDGGREWHFYEKGTDNWLFGVNPKFVNRSDVIEIMKMYRLNYPLEFLNELV